MNAIKKLGRMNRSFFLLAALILGQWLWIPALPASAHEMSMAPSDNPSDLTGLSLQELYNLDIIQMNVLGAHTHPAGEFMVGYQFMYMDMEGIRSGGHAISPQEVFAQGFAVAHTKMEMEEHMFDVMYAPTDRFTMMAMLSYKVSSMQHLTPANTTFTQRASGIGDLQLMGMYTLLGDIRKGGNRLVLDLGVSLPTGSTDVKDHNLGNPALPLTKLEYPMQFGSGTYDLLPGLTYLGDYGRWAWGAQTIETIRFGRNSSGYRFGNQYLGTTWGAYGVTEWFAPYARLEGRIWENIHGADPAYGAVPRSAEARPDKQAGERINLLFGLDLYVPKGVLMGNRFTLEGGIPIYEHLTGPQLGLSWTINAGWTYAF
jgi:hypothetical protein